MRAKIPAVMISFVACILMIIYALNNNSPSSFALPPLCLFTGVLYIVDYIIEKEGWSLFNGGCWIFNMFMWLNILNII